MYSFIDVTETSEGISLPSEALMINGEYIENLIEGYKTLTVEGREALSPEVSTYETGIRDGATRKGKRYPSRTLRITYQLVAETNEGFRTAYNKLASILDVVDAELIFNDETDKFFIGTPSRIGEVAPGKNAVVGEFDILCTDPFKYSVVEYEAEPVLEADSISLDYGGTYKSFPKLVAEFYNESDTSEDGETVTELTGNGDCGYVAFFNEHEKIIQIGDPDEIDGENAYQKSQTFINSTFKTSTAWGTAAQSQWALNAGITSSSAVEQAGRLAMGVSAYTKPSMPAQTSGTLLTATSKEEAPYIHYTVTANTVNRREKQVKISVTIAARLDNTSSYFRKGFSLAGAVYIGGAWHEVNLKDVNDIWEGTTSHKKSFIVNLSVAASTTSIAGIKFKAYRTDSTGGKSGILNETACKNFPISAYPTPQPEEYYLCPMSFGTGANWHGPSITRAIPADASGEVGATDFTLSYSQKMAIGSDSTGTKQLGAFQVLLVSGSGSARKIVAGVNIYKGASGKNANLRFYLDGSVKETTSIDLSYNNKYFNAKKTSTITKSGNKVTFNICGVTRAFQANELPAVNEVTFTFTAFGNDVTSKPPLEYNGLYWAKFVKDNCEIWRDIPNKFSANDIIEADCSTGKIYLNGVEAPVYGALGNDWEDFYLKPGLNQIGFSYSEWVEAAYAPKFKLKYREVFL